MRLICMIITKLRKLIIENHDGELKAEKGKSKILPKPPSPR